MSNIFAIFLQSLCIKLGSVTGMNLAENCKAHLPPWLNYVLYFFAESAIIATDIAEVRATSRKFDNVSLIRTGYWHCYRSQPAPPHSSRRRLRHIDCRRAGYPTFLPSFWEYEVFASI